MAHPRRQCGATLVESLIAFLVLSLGMVGIARLQSQLRLNADIARQRTEAVRLAQQDIETLRAFAAVGAASGVRSYADLESATSAVDAAGGYRSNASYRLERHVADGDGAAMKTATVTVSWSDRTGGPQHVLLQSAVAGIAPALSGALSAQEGRQPLKTVWGRSPFIPPGAKDLGNGSSVFRPSAADALALVFSNTTGQITSRCTGAGGPAGEVTASDLRDCAPFAATLLSGWVRFSLGASPKAAPADETVLPLSISLALSDGTPSTPPTCFTEARQGALAYHCVIVSRAGGWTGSSTVVPRGWTIGTAAQQFKVCRYSADQDGSGAVDSNAEHLERYSHVDGTLMQQNFLIIRGDQACPEGPVATVQHQP